MCIPVHSPWLPGYISVVQTILVALTMAGLFPDRQRERERRTTTTMTRTTTTMMTTTRTTMGYKTAFTSMTVEKQYGQSVTT